MNTKLTNSLLSTLSPHTSKTFVSRSSIWFLMVIGIFFTACEKDSIHIESDRQNYLAIKYPNTPENPHWKYITGKTNSNLISTRGTMIPLNDGILYLNEGMNFLYCRPVEYYYETKIRIDTLTIPLSSGQVDEDDLINLMDEAADLAGAFYHADQRGDKEPLMFDFNIIYPTSSTSANIQVVFYYMGGLMPETIDAYPYTDSWIYGQFYSDVSEFCSEEEENFDAADLFRRDLRKALSYRSKFDYYYFIGPEYACYHPLTCGSMEIPDAYNTLSFDLDLDAIDLVNGDDITGEDNFYDLLIFSNYSGWDNYHTCLSIPEMNFYYEEMYDLAVDFLPDPVGNKAIVNLEVGYDLFFDDWESAISQSMIVIKATRVTVLEEDKEPIALPDPE